MSETWVLIHGLGSSKEDWKTFASHVPDGVRVVALDLPGHGENAADGFSCSIADFARVLSEKLAELKIVSPVLIGHSLGAQIAARYLLQGGKAKAFVMVAPAGIETFEPLEGKWLAAVENGPAYQFMPHSVTALRMRQLSYKEPADFAERVQRRVTRMAGPDGAAYAQVLARCVQGMIEGPVHDELHRISQPTLVVFGAFDQRIPNKLFHPTTTQAVGEQAVELIPHAQLVMLPEVGHMVPEEAPQQLAAEVLRFLGTL